MVVSDPAVSVSSDRDVSPRAHVAGGATARIELHTSPQTDVRLLPRSVDGAGDVRPAQLGATRVVHAVLRTRPPRRHVPIELSLWHQVGGPMAWRLVGRFMASTGADGMGRVPVRLPGRGTYALTTRSTLTGTPIAPDSPCSSHRFSVR
jgi:hypothetical protein